MSTVHSTTSALIACILYYTYSKCTPSHQLRSASLNLIVHQPRLHIALITARSIRHTGPSILNSLPPNMRSIDSYTLPSNLLSKLTYSRVLTFLGLAAPNVITILLLFSMLRADRALVWFDSFYVRVSTITAI